MTNPVRVHLIAHSHWDREWYRTQTAYNARLLRVLDDLLEGMAQDPEMRFTLDGQLAPVEDYLALRPDRREQLAALVAEGRLEIGPWFVLADAFLVGGESLVRNLELGCALARALGGESPVGYLPDAFGHPESLPMILAGFGIRAAVFWRGMPARFSDGSPGGQCEFCWASPDGSEVLALYLPQGYCLGPDYPAGAEAQRAFVAAYAARHAARSLSAVLALTVGCDHMRARRDLTALQPPGAEALPSGLGAFAAEAKARLAGARLPYHQGELREGFEAPLLSSVSSSRFYLKREDWQTESLLTRYAEPAAALAGLDAPTLAPAWRELLYNQPHDSICGCSVDAVHREMMTRYARAQEAAELVFAESFGAARQAWRQAGEDLWLSVFNPLPQAFDGWLETEVQLPDNLRSVEIEGAAVDSFEPLGYGAYVVEDPSAFPHCVAGTRYRLRLRLRLEPLAVASFALRAAEAPARREATAPLAEGLYADAATGLRFRLDGEDAWEFGLDFESGGDAGDLYSYSPPRHDRVVSARVCAAARADGRVLAAWRVDYGLELPAGLTAARTRRSARRLQLPIAVAARRPSPERLELSIDGRNPARDHRLRLVLRLPFAPTAVVAGGAYAATARGVAPADDACWLEPAQRTAPFRGWLMVEGDRGGLMIAAPGLAEYELADGVLYLTLLRAVGWLSRGDLAARPVAAGPSLETPEAQCLGRFAARLTLLRFGGAPPWDALQAALYPPRALLCHQPLARPSLLGLSPGLMLGSLRRLGNELELRVFNPGAHAVRGEARLGAGVAYARAVRLDGSPLAATERVRDGRLPLELPPRGLATLRLREA